MAGGSRISWAPIAGADDFGYFSKSFRHCSVHEYQWRGCHAGKGTLGIQSHGQIKGCLSLPDELDEGNVRERSLYDIWHDPKAFSYSRHFDASRLQGACRECVFGVDCKGGCIDMAMSLTGHPFENPYCMYANGL